MQIAEQLKEKIYKVALEVEAKDIGIAFSGGVDSSLLAKTCKDTNKNITLLTIGFASQKDIIFSQQVSRILDLPLLHQTIALDEMERGLRKVLAVIEYDRIIRLENCLSFYHVFEMSSKHKIRNVLSANGADELFCGYYAYARHFTQSRASMLNLMNKHVETARRDKEEVDKLSKLFNINYQCPFLSESFVESALKIPIRLKIRGKEDRIRKHVLREAALEAGVPKIAALRPKKAFQYSSGIHKAIQRLAKKRGFTKEKAKKTGHRSALQAYIDNLKNPQDHNCD